MSSPSRRTLAPVIIPRTIQHSSAANSATRIGREAKLTSSSSFKIRPTSRQRSMERAESATFKKPRFSEGAIETRLNITDVQNRASGVPPTSYNISTQINSASPTKSRMRVPKVWKHPSHIKLNGLWDQYEETWFDIHSKGMMPLFADFPMPFITKSLNDLDTTIREVEDCVEEIQITAPAKKQKSYQIRVLSSKLKKIEDSLTPCDKCKIKKRKGGHIGCKHYFCRDCLKEHIQEQIEALKVPIECPKDNCNYELERSEIVKYAGNSEGIIRYFDLNVADYVKRRPHKMVQCFSENCKFVIDITKSKNKNIINCPRCKISYCLACHKPMNKGHRCEDDNNKQAEQNMQREGLFMDSSPLPPKLVY